MSAEVSVERISPDKLTRESWDFWYLPSTHELALMRYMKDTRGSTGECFVLAEVWHRMGGSGVGTHRGIASPPTPEDVGEEAKQQFAKKLGIQWTFNWQ